MTVVNSGNPRDSVSTDPDSFSIQRDPHEVEQGSTEGRAATKEVGGAIRHSEDLRRTASHVLTQVASRMTTRSWREPPPPPDGGVKAWTQVAMAWLVMVCTERPGSIGSSVPEIVSLQFRKLTC